MNTTMTMKPQGNNEASKRYEVRDGSRILRFSGVQLAFVSSEKDDSLRWTEMSVYRTDNGHFIAHRVGVSCVAHRWDCREIEGKTLPSVLALGGAVTATEPGAIVVDNAFGVEDREPCPHCRPDIQAAKADPGSVLAETDRYWSAVCDNPASLINAWHSNHQGARSLSSLASSLLTDAANHDAQIAAALHTPFDV